MSRQRTFEARKAAVNYNDPDISDGPLLNLAKAFLIEHPEDEFEPITTDWFQSIGGRLGLSKREQHHLGPISFCPQCGDLPPVLKFQGCFGKRLPPVRGTVYKLLNLFQLKAAVPNDQTHES